RIVGLLEQDAVITIRNANFKTGEITRENSETYPEGMVIRQNPQEGVSLIEGNAVDFVVSLGPKITEVPVPSLTDKTIDQARILLSEQQLELGNVERKVDDAPEGRIVDQNPAPGAMVSVGSKVDVYLSSGP